MFIRASMNFLFTADTQCTRNLSFSCKQNEKRTMQTKLIWKELRKKERTKKIGNKEENNNKRKENILRGDTIKEHITTTSRRKRKKNSNAGMEWNIKREFKKQKKMHFKVNTYIFDMWIYSAYELRLILPDSDGDSLLLSFQIV